MWIENRRCDNSGAFWRIKASPDQAIRDSGGESGKQPQNGRRAFFAEIVKNFFLLRSAASVIRCAAQSRENRIEF
ncbi:MAG TPA: hypothetical protein VNZ94_07955 [Xanthobacteraceae bacterium]|nr:hypothetical protein [Xanthobacteraceae bacterium]